MPNAIIHVALPDLLVNFSYDETLKTLTLTRASGDGNPKMFLWRADAQASTVQILKDTSSDLEISKEIPLSTFPFDEVVSTLQNNFGSFPQGLSAQIIRILQKCQNENTQLD